MKSFTFWKLRGAVRTVPLLAASLLSFGQNNVLGVTPPEKVTAKAGTTIEVKLSVHVRPGYHINSNQPSDEYLIPLKLSWDPGSLSGAPTSLYPKPSMEKYSFSEKPLSVYTGDFEITTRFGIKDSASSGPATIPGKLRYQACTDRLCLPPKTVEIQLPIEIVK